MRTRLQPLLSAALARACELFACAVITVIVFIESLIYGDPD